MEANPLPPEDQKDSAKASPQFRFLFCRHFGCPETEFERRAFKRCLYAQARVLAPLLAFISPHFFDRDHAFIKSLGTTTRVSHVDRLASHFRDKVGHDADFLFKVLRIRVSGSKAIRLADQLFGQWKAATCHSADRPTVELFER